MPPGTTPGAVATQRAIALAREQGRSVEELAAAVGLSRVGLYRRREAGASVDEVYALAAALEVAPAVLLPDVGGVPVRPFGGIMGA